MGVLTTVLKWAWNNPGEVVEPSSNLKNNGYGTAGGKQPAAENHNWLFQRSDDQYNRLVQEARWNQALSPWWGAENEVTGLPPTATPYWGPHADSPANQIGGPATTALHPGWNYTDDRPVMYACLLGDNTQIKEMYDEPETGLTASTLRPITTGLTAPFDLVGVCSDGPNVWVLASKSDQAHIFKYSANPWNPVAVAELHTTIPVTMAPEDTASRGLIVADADNLAFLADVPSSTGFFVVVQKTLAGYTQGRGNATSSADRKPGKQLVSNGRFLCCVSTDFVSFREYVNCATVTDPTTAVGLGGAITEQWFVDRTVINEQAGPIAYTGKFFVLPTSKGRVFVVNPDVTSQASPKHVLTLSAVESEDWKEMAVAFDGSVVYVLIGEPGTGTIGDEGLVVVPIPADELTWWKTPGNVPRRIQMFSVPVSPKRAKNARMATVGGSLWVSPDVTGTLWTTTHRIPNAYARR